MMATVSGEQRKRLHPHKFTLLIAIGSIVMMFAGFTSAYVVKSNQDNWLQFSMPPVFWYSTGVILISSLTMYLAQQAFVAREKTRYRLLILLTAVLGIVFMVLQWMGFGYLEAHGVQLLGSGSNAAGSFLAVITGVHMLHVLGGVVLLVVMALKSMSSHTRSYNTTPVEMTSIYWHFVDGLWIYLFIFYNYISG